MTLSISQELLMAELNGVGLVLIDVVLILINDLYHLLVFCDVPVVQ